MAKLLIGRRPGAVGKLRNGEPLILSASDSDGNTLCTEVNANSWDDFLFHLGPVTPRRLLHQADRDLRKAGFATLLLDNGVVDEVWIKSFLLAAE